MYPDIYSPTYCVVVNLWPRGTSSFWLGSSIQGIRTLLYYFTARYIKKPVENGQRMGMGLEGGGSGGVGRLR